jgi:hypothetical protein
VARVFVPPDSREPLSTLFDCRQAATCIMPALIRFQMLSFIIAFVAAIPFRIPPPVARTNPIPTLLDCICQRGCPTAGGDS